eukprot:5909857-Pyramimonas_sp.AAC.1
MAKVYTKEPKSAAFRPAPGTFGSLSGTRQLGPSQQQLAQPSGLTRSAMRQGTRRQPRARAASWGSTTGPSTAST